jgi:hypothetical protein
MKEGAAAAAGAAGAAAAAAAAGPDSSLNTRQGSIVNFLVLDPEGRVLPYK